MDNETITEEDKRNRDFNTLLNLYYDGEFTEPIPLKKETLYNVVSKPRADLATIKLNVIPLPHSQARTLADALKAHNFRRVFLELAT